MNTVTPLTPEEFARNFAEIHPAFAPQEAVVEANRCLFCFDAPCTNACPISPHAPVTSTCFSLMFAPYMLE